jgi:hypothetical protein
VGAHAHNIDNVDPSLLPFINAFSAQIAFNMRLSTPPLMPRARHLEHGPSYVIGLHVSVQSCKLHITKVVMLGIQVRAKKVKFPIGQEMAK